MAGTLTSPLDQITNGESPKIVRAAVPAVFWWY
jgi:hypothetical protein